MAVELVPKGTSLENLFSKISMSDEENTGKHIGHLTDSEKKNILTGKSVAISHYCIATLPISKK